MSKMRYEVQLEEKKIMVAEMHLNHRMRVWRDGGITHTGRRIRMLKNLAGLKGGGGRTVPHNMFILQN